MEPTPTGIELVLLCVLPQTLFASGQTIADTTNLPLTSIVQNNIDVSL